jgi:hypothetical protein
MTISEGTATQEPVPMLTGIAGRGAPEMRRVRS